MTLWADADSLPREVRELIGRRAGSSGAGFPIRAVFVANRPLPLPPGPNLKAVIVGPAGASARPVNPVPPAPFAPSAGLSASPSGLSVPVGPVSAAVSGAATAATASAATASAGAASAGAAKSDGAAKPAMPENAAGWSSADDYIVSSAEQGDILITRDIPLAARALERGIVVINDRGALWTVDSVRERLSLRDHMTALRELGVAPPPAARRGFGPKELKAFADALDRAIQAAISARRAPSSGTSL